MFWRLNAKIEIVAKKIGAAKTCGVVHSMDRVRCSIADLCFHNKTQFAFILISKF
jgi:hypothetical protein